MPDYGVQQRGDQRMLVTIIRVDLRSRTCEAFSKLIVRDIIVRLNLFPSGLCVVPNVGEQWMVQKNGIDWYLEDKLDFNDARTSLPPEVGLTAIGTTGPTYVMGSRVQLASETYVGSNRIHGGRSRYYASATRAIPINTATLAPINTLAAGSLGGVVFDAANNRVQVVEESVVTVHARATLTTMAANTALRLALRQNGVDVAANSLGVGATAVADVALEVSDALELEAGDTVALWATYGGPGGTANSSFAVTTPYNTSVTLT